MRKIVILAACLVAYTCTVQAAELPQYDIKATCKEIADFGGHSNVIELQCRKDEQAAARRLTKRDVPVSIMQTCDEVSRTMGEGSYTILEQCIKDELKAKEQLN